MNQETKKGKEKWWQYRKIGKEEAKKITLWAFLWFIICYFILGSSSLITDFVGLVFWLGGIAWIVKVIQFKIKETKENNKNSE